MEALMRGKTFACANCEVVEGLRSERIEMGTCASITSYSVDVTR